MTTSVHPIRLIATCAMAAVVSGLVAACVSMPSGNSARTELPRVAAGGGATVFDGDPDHLWNRLYFALRARHDKAGALHGLEEVDPLLWELSTNLLEEPGHSTALRVLDKFLSTGGEKLTADPAKRALLQSTLWAVFDWTADRIGRLNRPFPAQRVALQERLAKAVSRLGMSKEEIQRIPDNYEAAIKSKKYPAEFDRASPEIGFLPPQLFDKTGPWVAINMPRVIAPAHTKFVSGRSGFAVFMRLPGDRETTVKYVQTLGRFPNPLILDEHAGPMPNKDLPQFPEGTQVALVRVMLVVDRAGQVQQTPLVESVQLRVYRSVDKGTPENERQSFFEYQLSPTALVAGDAGGLRLVAPDEPVFSLFRDRMDDEIDTRRQLFRDSCIACHAQPGVQSFQAALRGADARFPGALGFYESVGVGPPSNIGLVVRWKNDQYDFGLLHGMMQQGGK